MLKGTNISVQVGNKTLLSNASIKVKQNELAVVLGPNGAGKSTLLKTLSGDIAINKGAVSYQGKALEKHSSDNLAKVRAVLTQNYDCEFPFSVQEIVDMAHYVHQNDYSKSELAAFSQQAMATLHVEHLAKQAFPRLSGGEKQRVQFARVLCQLLPILERQKPCYLLIDEPTASLDLYHQYQVMHLAKEVAKMGAGVIAVVHDLALAASFANTAYLLENGKIVAYGNPKNVLNEPQLKNTYGISAHLAASDGFLPNLRVAAHFG